MQENTKVTEQTLSGTNLINWLKLLRENKFRVSWKYLPRALFVSLLTSATAPFALYERIRYGKKIRQTKITKPPVFIIGHWRSGTTFLHSLMIQDKQFGYISNMNALMPDYYIGSGKLFQGILKRLLPKKRRMDNIKLDLHEPQEDEYALANISSYSLYHGIAFPQNIRYYSRFCSLDTVPEKTVRRWKRVFQRLLKKITYSSNGKRLVLKNPTHTYRIKLLLELYPNAKFIHIYRNPLDVFPSTLRMYQKMFPYFFLQEPFSEEEGKELIFDLYDHMFEKFFAQKDLIPQGNLIEIKYEDFTKQPFEGLQTIYEQLDLPGFDRAQENFRRYIDSQRSYKKNKHDLDETLKQEIIQRWNHTMKKWGYLRVNRLEKRIKRKNKRYSRKESVNE